MKSKFIFLLSFLFFYLGCALAQESRIKKIGVETGITFSSSELSDLDFIRGEIPNYYAGYSSNTLISLSNKIYVGIKSEIFSLNGKFGFAGGIRFSRFNNSVGKNDYWASNTNYFYWLYREDGLNTEYLKVKEINQVNDYLGIPLEVRFSPARKDRLVRIYFKLGAELNYLVQTQTKIIFKDNDMGLYESELNERIEKPGKFSSSIYGGGGLRLGRNLKPSVSIEAHLLNVFLTSKSSGLVYPKEGGGFQLNMQVPIKSKVQ
jgi:hypothetical protein